jgi:hypothetical protein
MIGSSVPAEVGNARFFPEEHLDDVFPLHLTAPVALTALREAPAARRATTVRIVLFDDPSFEAYRQVS